MLLKIVILRMIVGLLVLVAGLLLCGTAYQFIATKLDARAYPAAGKMIDIDGYSLHINCSGKGSPTVVLDAGMGCSSLGWSLVQPEITKFTRVCSYDRAGMGWSDTSSLPRTSEHIAQELHKLLKNAHIPAPYILVGHSSGGINVRLYANMYPDEVVGIVLVDASHEDQLQKLPEEMTNISFNQPLLLFLNAIGFIRLMTYLPKNRSAVEELPLPADAKKVWSTENCVAKRMKTTFEEHVLFKDSCKQLKNSENRSTNKPLTVITAGKSSDLTKAGYSQELVDQFTIAWDDLQKDLVAKSICGKQIVAEESGHMIVFEQPEIIVDAVREMVTDIRAQHI